MDLVGDETALLLLLGVLGTLVVPSNPFPSRTLNIRVRDEGMH